MSDINRLAVMNAWVRLMELKLRIKRSPWHRFYGNAVHIIISSICEFRRDSYIIKNTSPFGFIGFRGWLKDKIYSSNYIAYNPSESYKIFGLELENPTAGLSVILEELENLSRPCSNRSC